MTHNLKMLSLRTYSPCDVGLSQCQLESWAYVSPSGRVDRFSVHWLVRTPEFVDGTKLHWFAEEHIAQRFLARYARARREAHKLSRSAVH